MVRLTEDVEAPQRGVLLLNGIPFCITLELPWHDNKCNASCIPEGTYRLEEVFNVKLFSGKKIPRTFLVCDVPKRGGILFHTGNTKRDTKGCILLGSSFSTKDDSILGSRLAFDDFLTATATKHEGFLVVKSLL